MSHWWYSLFKSIAFKLDPEHAHELAIDTLAKSKFLSGQLALHCLGPDVSQDRRYGLQIGSLNWPFPVGLAAGLDKDARAVDFFTALPFGAIEVGTVTPLAQPGNPKPRLFRYPEETSLRNCMGFNNAGAEAMARQLLSSNKHGKLLGVNIGKNKATAMERAHEDYVSLYRQLAPFADYLVINISSPNTPGLRDLHAKESLDLMFESLSSERKQCPKPLFIKISPDASEAQIEQVIDSAKRYQLAGIVATNTTTMPERGEGGISGTLLAQKSRRVRQFVLERTRECPELAVIGVGGIASFEDLWEFWQMGGKVVQVYTSFIYQGPAMLFDWAQKIDQACLKYGVRDLTSLLSMLDKRSR